MTGATQRGFGLVETLMATLISAVLLGVLLQFAITAQSAVGVQADAVDLQQRLRVAASMLQNDLTMAGAGPSQGGWRGGLGRVFAPIVPARIGSRHPDAELSHHADRISIIYVPDTSSQTTIRTAMGTAGAPLAIDAAAPGCPGGGTCGFSRGDRVLVFDPVDVDRAYDLFTVSDAAAGLLLPASALSKPYGVGGRVLRVVQRVYHLDRPGSRLMVYDGDSSDMPLVDHVVDLRFTYYAEPPPASVPPPAEGQSDCTYAGGSPPASLLQDLGGQALKALTPGQLTDGPSCGVAPNRYDADLLRVRRVRVTLRLEAEAADLRGSGALFMRPGTSVGGLRYLPDQQVTFDVAPRNMGGVGYGPR
jgi:type II secretory pathway pseudopilin PulG